MTPSFSPQPVPQAVLAACGQHNLYDPFYQEGNWWAFKLGDSIPTAVPTLDKSFDEQEVNPHNTLAYLDKRQHFIDWHDLHFQ